MPVTIPTHPVPVSEDNTTTKFQTSPTVHWTQLSHSYRTMYNILNLTSSLKTLCEYSVGKIKNNLNFLKRTPFFSTVIFLAIYVLNFTHKLNSFHLWTSQKVRYYGMMRGEGREKGETGCFGTGPVCLFRTLWLDHRLKRFSLLFQPFSFHRFKVLDGVPPWLESFKAHEVALSNAWMSNSNLRNRFLDEFIKDSLHEEISIICR